MTQSRRRGEWVLLERALGDRGIDRAHFEAQALRAIEQAWRSPTAADPPAAFTADEVSVLRQGGLDLAPRGENEPDIVLQTATALAVIETKAAPVAEVASALRVSRARVRQRVVERTLYAIRIDNEWRFPRWQFDELGQVVPGIAAVVSALPTSLHPVAVWRFMSEPDPDLEILGELLSPLQWLRAGGDPTPVAVIAREL